jgi:cysteine desulfurase / selenocysteine lyase
MPRPVVQCVKEVLDREHLVGGYEAQEYYSEAFNEVYESIGRLIGCDYPTVEIALMDSATTAWSRAFYSIPLRENDVILVSKVEYGANMVAILQQSRRKGAMVMYIPSSSSGCVSLPALQNMLENTPNVRAVCLTWIPTNGGVVNDARGVGEICALFPDVFYLLDACQAVGQVCVDVRTLRCSMLAATGRKYLRGPRGTGFLYVSSDVLSRLDEPITLDHAAAPWVELDEYCVLSTARRFEQWEKNVSGLIGLGRAIDYALDVDVVGMEWAQRRIRELGSLLRKSLVSLSEECAAVMEQDPEKASRATPELSRREQQGGRKGWETRQQQWITVWDMGDEGDSSTRCGIVTFSVLFVNAESLKKILKERNIFVSVSAPGSTLIDATERSLPTIVRASLHYFNTDLEIFILCDTLREIFNEICG